MNGNSKLTETENVIFYVSYGILTDELTYFCIGDTSTDQRQRNAGNQVSVNSDRHCVGVLGAQVCILSTSCYTCWAAGPWMPPRGPLHRPAPGSVMSLRLVCFFLLAENSTQSSFRCPSHCILRHFHNCTATRFLFPVRLTLSELRLELKVMLPLT